MATTRFKTTIDAIKGGVKKFTIDKAVQNIEGWEEYLGKHDHEGVKAVVQDLAKLKKLLHAKEIDGDAVKKLVAKMGKDTVKVAGDGENAEAKHIRELGEALSAAADKQGDDADDEETSAKSVESAEADVDEEIEAEDDEEELDEDDDEDEEELDDEEDEVEDDDEEDDDEDEDDEDEDDDDEDDSKEPTKKAPAKKSAAKKSTTKGKK